MGVTFRSATDELLGMNQAELAEALGCSIPSLRQARLREDAKARSVAPNWLGIDCRQIGREEG